MKITKSTDANIIKKSRSTCIITDYAFKNKNLDLVIAEIKGRYPETGYCMNKKCDEIGYILKGGVVLTKKGGTSVKLSVGDGVLLNKGEMYCWEGSCKMIISCSPAWSAKQYEHIKE